MLRKNRNFSRENFYFSSVSSVELTWFNSKELILLCKYVPLSFSIDSLLNKHSSKTTLVVAKLLSIIAIKKKHI